jgi:hypothetical protein
MNAGPACLGFATGDRLRLMPDGRLESAESV